MKDVTYVGFQDRFQSLALTQEFLSIESIISFPSCAKIIDSRLGFIDADLLRLDAVFCSLLAEVIGSWDFLFY